jgi:hypothetical protein
LGGSRRCSARSISKASELMPRVSMSALRLSTLRKPGKAPLDTHSTHGINHGIHGNLKQAPVSVYSVVNFQGQSWAKSAGVARRTTEDGRPARQTDRGVSPLIRRLEAPGRCQAGGLTSRRQRTQIL